MNEEYERGFIDGMQKQMQSSVDKAVNRMAQPEQEYESVLIDGVAYTIPSKVAVEILGLHLDLLQLKQEQEPVCPAWVGLTDEEISELIRATHNTGSFVRAIEAKLKEKNT